MSVLVLCYGNPGRLDDGLGPALGALLEKEELPEVEVEINYQLAVEDAAAVAAHEAVLFVDAAVQGPAPFAVQRLGERAGAHFSSHSVEPGQLLYMARTLYGARPSGWALAIRGYEFDAFGERLSAPARANLKAAHQYIAPLLRAGLPTAIRGQEVLA